MARRSRLTSWVVPFAVGLIIGLLIDLALRVGGSLNWVLVAIPFGAAAVTVVGSIAAEIFRQGLQEDADRRRRQELHAESLSENALAWLQNLVFDSDLWDRTGRQFHGLCINGAQGNTPVSSLKLWRYAEDHIAQDPVLGPKWKTLKEDVEARDVLRQSFAQLLTEKVEAALAREFGPGWVPAAGFETPQPPRWYNADLIWNWVLSKRELGPFKDEITNMGYGRSDIPNEMRCYVSGGGMNVISSNDQGDPRAEKTKVLCAGLQADASLRKLQGDLERTDENLSKEAFELRVPADEFYERTVESKHLVGRCPVCP